MNTELKKHIKIIAMIMAVFCLISVGLLLLGGEQLHSKRVSSGDPVTATAGTMDLNAENSISQRFSIGGDHLNYITLYLITYERQNTCTLNLVVTDEQGNALGSKAVSAAGLTGSAAVPIFFDTPVETAPDEPMILTITSDGQPGNSVAFLYGDSVNLSKGSVKKEIAEADRIRFDGAPLNGVLCFEAVGTKELLFGEIYWYLAGAAALMLLALCIWTSRKILSGRRSTTVRIINAFRRYSFLIQQLVLRDFKAKYKRSVLGMLWSFLNPLLMMTIYLLVFSMLFNSNIEHFPAYLIIGIVFFGFFNEATSMSLQSIVGNAALITKVYVPKYIYPVSRVLSSGVNLLLSMIPLFLILVITGIPVRPQFLLVIFGVLCILMLSLGVGMLLASAMVFFRDIQFLWGIVTTMLNFLTPIFYPESIIPANFQFVLKLNPLYHIIRFVRIVLIDGISPEPKAYLYCLITTLVPLLLGVFVFRKTQDQFVLNL